MTHGAATTQRFRANTRCIEPSSSWRWRSFATHAGVVFVSSGLAWTACTDNRWSRCRRKGKGSSPRFHSDRHIYVTDPAPYLPAQGLGPGRPRERYHSNAQAVEVRKWVKMQPASAWRKKTLRDTSKGDLIVEVLHQRVRLWDKHSPNAHCWHLIVRREVDSPSTLSRHSRNQTGGCTV